ncbi:MAG: hypothetical protein HN671_05370 [Rhodobacterales bacterium]|nr:hypothetical protein [Rhodobacterales bacterium]MDG1963265.1 hypothetical protein [Amylibacter sp.]MDG2156839.1 hypothetical protein [Amylibacter sp.]
MFFLNKLFFVILLLISQPSLANEKIIFYPKSIDKDCFAGRALSYDECGYQKDVLKKALLEAIETDKTVLIIYGAEWCIWCHVFKEHIKGNYGKFSYKLEGQQGYDLDERPSIAEIKQANELNAFVSQNFIVANIEAQHSFDGYDVLFETGGAEHIKDSIPFIYTVDQNGLFSKDMPSTHELKTLEKKRNGDNWYRGYNREVLLEELKKLLN